MPLYDRKCNQCCNILRDVIESPNDTGAIECPGCDGQMERMLSAPSVLLCHESNEIGRMRRDYLNGDGHVENPVYPNL